MASIDLHGFVVDLKSHVGDHGFHVADDRHYVETYSNRQHWEVEMHPERGCGGPLSVVMTLEAEARTLIDFEDDLYKAATESDLSDEIIVPLTFTFMLPPLVDGPDLLVLTTELAAIGGIDLPLRVTMLDASEVVSSKPERTINIEGRVDLPLAHMYRGEDALCDLLERACEICTFLLEQAPVWLDEVF